MTTGKPNSVATCATVARVASRERGIRKPKLASAALAFASESVCTAARARVGMRSFRLRVGAPGLADGSREAQAPPAPRAAPAAARRRRQGSAARTPADKVSGSDAISAARVGAPCAALMKASIATMNARVSALSSGGQSSTNPSASNQQRSAAAEHRAHGITVEPDVGMKIERVRDRHPIAKNFAQLRGGLRWQWREIERQGPR